MTPLYLLIGLLVGYFCRDVYNYVRNIYLMLKEKFDVNQAGVVKPERSKVTRRPGQPTEIDLTSDTGGVLRPTPDEVLTARMKERNKNIEARG